MRDNDPGGTAREGREPRKKAPTPTPTVPEPRDRDWVCFPDFRILCAPCEIFGNRKSNWGHKEPSLHQKWVNMSFVTASNHTSPNQNLQYHLGSFTAWR